MEIRLLKEELNKIIPKKYKLIEVSNTGRDGYFKFSNLFSSKVIYVYFSPYKDIEIIKTSFLKRKHLSYKTIYKIRGDHFSYYEAIKKLILDKII